MYPIHPGFITALLMVAINLGIQPLCLFAATADNKSLKSHDHGQATVYLVGDGLKKEVLLRIEGAGMAILGHEKILMNPKQKREWKRLKSRFNESLIGLPPALGCVLNKKDIQIITDGVDSKNEKAHKANDHSKCTHQHTEIHGELHFKCKKSPAGAKVSLETLFSTFKRPKNVEVQVLPAQANPYIREIKRTRASNKAIGEWNL